MFHLSPSILAADFTKLGEQVMCVEKAGADWLHIDVMDGMFVPSISFGMPVIKSLRPMSQLFFDVHLMVEEPIRYICDFAQAGADLITVHAEACKDVGATINAIKAQGCKAGISINPETEEDKVFPWIEQVDLILVMSVHPGFGGQKLIPETLDKMKKISKWIAQKNPGCHLEADGGIHAGNVRELLDAGVNVIVAGTAVFGGDIAENVRQFYNIAAEREIKA